MALPSFVKGASAVTASGTSITVTFTGLNSVGNSVIIFMGHTGTSDRTTGCSDTQGNSYTKVFSAQGSDANNSRWQTCWVAPVTGVAGTNNAVTITISGASSSLIMRAVEYKNVRAASPLDHGLGVNNSQTATVVSTNAGELALLWLEFLAGGNTYTGVTVNIVNGNNNGFVGELVPTTAGNNVLTMTVSGGNITGGLAVTLFASGKPQRTLMGVGQ